MSNKAFGASPLGGDGCWNEMLKDSDVSFVISSETLKAALEGALEYNVTVEGKEEDEEDVHFLREALLYVKSVHNVDTL
jgi:hypothetical protein